MRQTIFILSGPNLNLLGTREPQIYGTATLADIEDKCRAKAAELGFDILFRQSNHEGDLIDWLHEAHTDHAKAVLLNAGAYTHTSIALHDAIKAIDVPVIEVHLSDPLTREPFRHLSYIAMAAADGVKGHGPRSYVIALERAAAL